MKRETLSQYTTNPFSLEGGGTGSIPAAALPPSLEGEGWDEGEYNQSIPFSSATAPCVALPPASMQSSPQPSPAGEGVFRGFLSLTLLLLVTTFNTPAYAESKPRQYHIPAGSLATALNSLAETSDLQVIYDTQLTQGINSKGLSGSYSADAALHKLLSGTGLAYTLADGTVTIQAAGKPKAKPFVPVANPKVTEPTSETTLEKVTVEADSAYDPDYYADPYNQDYVLPNATAGTKTDTPIMETPLNVQVISKQVLKDQQVISLDKALKNVSGVTVTKPGTDVNSDITLRGFSSYTTFRNGFRMDADGGVEPGSRQQFANVESVEVLKGPAAILYGRVEPGGMVNIVTKQPLATPYYALNQQFGSYDLYRTSIDASGPVTDDNTLLYRFNGSFQSNRSFRDLVQGEDVFLAPILKWNISPRTQVTLEMEYDHAMNSGDIPILPFDSKHNRLIDIIPHTRNFTGVNLEEKDSYFVGLNWSHQFNDDWSIKHQVSFKRGENLATSPFPSTLNLATREVVRDIFYERDLQDTIATYLDLTGHFNTWGLEHTLLLGGDYYRVNFDADVNSGGPSIVSLDNPVHPGPNMALDPAQNIDVFYNTDNYGLYIQDQIKLPYNIHIMGGLRYQYVHQAGATKFPGQTPTPNDPQTDDAVTPRVGLLWQPKKWLSLYSNYAENFGANTGRGFLGKPLPPESAQQWEVGAKTELFNGRFRASLAYYDLTKQNVATNDPLRPTQCGGGPCSIAIGEVNSRGPELDIQGEILPGWNVIATYANQDVRITKSNNGDLGNRLASVPRNVASFWTTYEFQQVDFKGLKFGGGVNMQDSVVEFSNTFKSPGYALVGLMTSYSMEFGKTKITAQLNVDNLLDKDYVTNVFPSGSLADVTFSTPRTFMGQVSIQY